MTRQSVLALVQRIEMKLTTKEMARVLQVKEVSIRAAIIWLEIGGYIRKEGTFIRRYHNKPYIKKISLWRWTGKTDSICRLCIKDTDKVDRERMSMFNNGDCGVTLQNILMGISK